MTLRTKGTLIPHRDFLISACAEGLEWTEIRRRLATKGVDITSPGICIHCTRRGYALLHPYSIHYDEMTARKFRAGEIGEDELLKIAKNK